jgi:hypothetical protein
MKEAFFKIIERLEDRKRYYSNESEHDKEIGQNQWCIVNNRCSWAINEVIKIVNQVVEECNDGWIPTSERMPDKDGEYLVWYDYGEDNDEDSERGYMLVPFWTDIEKFGVYQDTYHPETLGFLDSEFYECETVIAWRPLPAPYKPKGE